MGPIFIIVAINTKRAWLRGLCLLIAIVGSAASVLSAGEMVLIALIQNAIAWIVWIAVGYAIRFGIRRIKRRTGKESIVIPLIKKLLSYVRLIPKALWRFTLNRVRELGKAFRDEDL